MASGRLPGLSRLIEAVESDVIPRLLASHLPSRGIVPGPEPEEVARLVLLLIEGDTARALAHFDAVARRGLGLQRLCLEMMAPAARRLGQMWDEDSISFTDVTLGLSTLHQLLFRLSLPDEQSRRAEGPAVLLAPCPGEQHFFATLMVARLFALQGWRPWTELQCDSTQLARLAAREEFPVIGLSISAEANLGRLSTTVAAIRRACADARPIILIGGPLAAIEPLLAERVGADAQVGDAPSGIRIAQKLVDLRSVGARASAPCVRSG